MDVKDASAELDRCYSIRFDHTTNVVIVACDRKEFGYTTEANTAIRIRGGTAPRHLARRLSPRTLGKKRPSLEKRAPRSFAFSLDQDWAEVEEWDLIPYVVVDLMVLPRILNSLIQRNARSPLLELFLQWRSKYWLGFQYNPREPALSQGPTRPGQTRQTNLRRGQDDVRGH